MSKESQSFLSVFSAVGEDVFDADNFVAFVAHWYGILRGCHEEGMSHHCVAYPKSGEDRFGGSFWLD